MKNGCFITIKLLVSMLFVVGLLIFDKCDADAYMVTYIKDIIYENGFVMSVNVGETKSLGLKIVPKNYTEPLTIKSSNESVLTVSKNGMMTGVSAGTAIVTISYGPTSGEIHVAVLGDHPQALICDMNDVSREITYPYQMEAIVFPAGKKLVWSSENESIATVNKDGVFIGKKAGTVRFKATVDGYGDETADYLTVIFQETDNPYDPSHIALDYAYIDTPAIVVGINKTITPNWKFEPSNHTQKIYYKSDHPEIASVDSRGRITGKMSGSAVISVGTNKDMFGGSWQFSVYVSDGQQRVYIRGGHEVVGVDIRNADHLDADIVPNNDQYSITWESSDDSIGSIDENGDILYHNNGIVKFTAKITEKPELFDYTVKIVGDGIEDQIVASGDADGEIVNDVVELLRDNDINDLQKAIKKSEKVQGGLKKLEKTYNKKNGIKVKSNSKVSELSANKIEVIGAGLNTRGKNSQMKLNLTKADNAIAISDEYTDQVAFDMTLYDGSKKANMSIPVVVTLPIPKGVNKDNMVILHEVDNGRDEVISPTFTKDGSAVELTLSHFSTFAFVWAKNTGKPAAKGKTIENNSARFVVTSSNAKSPTVAYKASRNSKATKITVPASIRIKGVTYRVTEIRKNAFKGNKRVKIIDINKNITKICDYAFSGCTALTQIKGGAGVKTIGQGVFTGCKKLNKIQLGANITSIGEKAFYNCESLTALTIPAKTTKLGNQFAKGTRKLKTLTIKNKSLKAKGIAKGAFTGIGSQKTVVKVPKKTKKSYTSMLQNKGLNKKIKIQESK